MRKKINRKNGKYLEYQLPWGEDANWSALKYHNDVRLVIAWCVELLISEHYLALPWPCRVSIFIIGKLKLKREVLGSMVPDTNRYDSFFNKKLFLKGGIN